MKDFTEIKGVLQNIGKNEKGEAVSKLFSNYVEKATKKTISIIKLIGMSNSIIMNHLPSFKGILSVSDLDRLLTYKGFKRSQILELSKDFGN